MQLSQTENVQLLAEQLKKKPEKLLVEETTTNYQLPKEELKSEIVETPQAIKPVEVVQPELKESQPAAVIPPVQKSFLTKNTATLIPNLNNPNGMKSPEEKEEEITELTGAEKEDFTTEEFLKAWVAYSTLVKSQNKMSLVTLLDHYTPTLKENYKIELAIENKFQANEMLNEKTEILNYLRTRLNNFSIQLETIIVEQMEIKKPYTSTDKYQFMAKKNPSLETFRKTFNLDLD